MNIITPEYAYYILWVVNTVYFFGIGFQIRANYKCQSAKGLSDLWLMGYVIAYITQILYTFALDLPLPCKVMLPLCLSEVLFIVLQRFYYHPMNEDERLLALSYFFLFIISLSSIPLTYAYPIFIGNFTGWIATVMWSIFIIPQVMKMYRTKSTAGYSLGYLSVMTFGGVLELISSLTLGLPLQSIASIVRGLIVSAIIGVQFFIYRHNK